MGNKRNVCGINPTLACADLLNLKQDLDILKEEGNELLHLDVMDGHYVPNLCFPLDVIREIRKYYDFLLDVHLMVTDPQSYILPLADAGADYVSFHLDATSFPVRLLREIKDCGMEGGVVLNPAQPAQALREVLPYLDLVLVMGVEPGFSGQSFIPGTVDKVGRIHEMREESGLSFLIEVDGGIDDTSMAACVKEGADILVSGAYGVFGGRNGLRQDYRDCVRGLKDCGRYADWMCR